MKVIRIHLKQKQANYRKEETLDNKMTYPLPTLSTVIGALHVACGYTSYHPMDVSIQGNYNSMGREVYTDYAFLNSTMNDRGILVKLKNPEMLSTAYVPVAKACAQGADFDREVKIDIYNKELLEEYKRLRVEKKQLDEENKLRIKPEVQKVKKEITALKKEQKQYEKTSEEFKNLSERINLLKQKNEELICTFNAKKDANATKYNMFASITTSLKSYEVLYGVELIIHIRTDEQTAEDILEHAYDIKAIGRSEDFVSVESVEQVELLTNVDNDVESCYSAYLPYNAVKNQDIMVTTKEQGVSAKGTVYFLNKNYSIVDGKRFFEKKRVLYCDSYFIDEESILGDSNVFYDGKYIVAFN